MSLDRLQADLYREFNKSEKLFEQLDRYGPDSEGAMGALFEVALKQAASLSASAACNNFVNERRKAVLDGIQ